jgi:hypothetical protein
METHRTTHQSTKEQDTMSNKHINNMMKSKTFWTGIGTIAGAGTAFATGALPAAGAVQFAINGLIAIFLRMAIEKQTPPN